MTSHQLILATLDYDDPRLKLSEPDTLRTKLTELSAVLEQQGFTRLATNDRVPLECTSDREFKDAALGAAQVSDTLVLYYTGHGYRQDADSFRLLMHDSTLDNVSASALAAQELAAQLRPGEDRTPPTVLLILDTCYAEKAGAALAWASLAGHINPNIHVITTAIDAAHPGEFAQFLIEILGSNTALSGHPRIGRAPRIQLGHIPALFNEKKKQKQAKYFPPVEGQDDFPPEFKNPAYVPGVAGQTIRDQQWWAKVRGIHGTETNELEGLYLTGVTGRRRALTRIAEWLNDEGPELVVVTGSPGSGKSVLLSLPVLLNDIPEEWREALATHKLEGSSLVTFAAQTLPATVDLKAIQVGGLNAETVAKQVAEWTQAPPPQDGESETDRLIHHLLQPAPPAGWLILDGLDEARLGEGHKILHLAESIAASGTIRVLVGSRPHMLSDEKRNDPETVDLDRPKYRDPQALTTYVRQVLLANQEPTASTWFQLATRKDVDAAAERIAEWATSIDGAESFLLAGTMAQGYRTTPWQPETPPWSQDRPDTTALFDNNMETLGSRAIKTKIVLAALAWAKGPGLPRPGIWLAVAQCLAEQQGLDPSVITSEDIQYALDHASGYIIEDIDPDGSSVYRPFHDLFTAYLQQRPPDDQLDTDKKWPQNKRDTNQAITNALLAHVRDSNGAPDWLTAPPYIRRYLIQHAADAGDDTVTHLVSDIDYLAVADPSITTLLLDPSAANSRLSTRSKVFRKARHRFTGNPVGNALRLNEAQVEIAEEAPKSAWTLPYETLLNKPLTSDQATLVLTGHNDWVTEVAFASLPNGPGILATASNDKTVQLWDPTTGEPLGTIPRGRLVSDIALVRLPDERVILAIADDDKVELWNPITGEFGGQLIDRDPYLPEITTLLGTKLANGQSILALGGSDGSLHLFNPSSRERIGEPLTAHTGAVTSVAAATLPNGRTILATAGADGAVGLWDPTTRRRIRKPLTAHIGAVNSLAAATLSNGRVILASAGTDSTVRLWDPTTRKPIGERLPGHEGEATSLAIAALPHGRALLASANWYSFVEIWDVSSSELIEILSGHSGGITSMTFMNLEDERLFLATTSTDHTVRIWDPFPTTGLASTRLQRHTQRISTVAYCTLPDGQPILTSGSWDGSVRLWNPTTGTQLGRPITRDDFPGFGGEIRDVALTILPNGRSVLAIANDNYGHAVHLCDPAADELSMLNLPGHTDRVNAIAFANPTEGCVTLATASRDKTVRFWDAATGQPIGMPLCHPGEVRAVAFGCLPCGQTVLASATTDHNVHLWDVSTGQPFRTPLTGHTGEVTSVAWGQLNGRTILATGSTDNTVRLWDPDSGNTVGTPLFGHSGEVGTVAWGQLNGRTILATGSTDKTVRLWDPDSGNTVGTPLVGHTDTVCAVTLATLPDGSVLLITGGDDRLLVVRLDPNYWTRPLPAQ